MRLEEERDGDLLEWRCFQVICRGQKGKYLEGGGEGMN